MSHKWTEESARSYVAKVQSGKNQIGLTYHSAADYLTNHVVSKKEKPILVEKENKNDNSKHYR